MYVLHGMVSLVLRSVHIDLVIRFSFWLQQLLLSCIYGGVD